MPTTVDDLRKSAAIDIITKRRIFAKPIGADSWRPMTINLAGRETAIISEVYTSPLDALEAAEAHLQATDTRRLEIEARELIQALAQGIYVPWPETDESNSARLRWVIMKVEAKGGEDISSSRIENLEPFEGLMSALIWIRQAVNSSNSSSNSSSSNHLQGI